MHIPYLYQQNYLTKRRSWLISIFSTSTTNLQSSPFTCNPDGHVFNGDNNTINNTSLREVFTKGSIYCEPKSINWKHNFKNHNRFRRRWCQTMSKTWKGGLRYSFRLGEECEVADTNYSLKTQWVYGHSLYINMYIPKCCKTLVSSPWWIWY